MSETREMIKNINILKAIKRIAELIDDKYLAELEEKLMRKLFVEIQKPQKNKVAKS